MVMKVKIKEYTTTEKELDLEYPYFLFFQDEDCIGGEYFKVWENYSICIKIDYEEHSISRKPTQNYSEHTILRNLTTEEDFNEQYEYLEEWLRNRKDGK